MSPCMLLLLSLAQISDYGGACKDLTSSRLLSSLTESGMLLRTTEALLTKPGMLLTVLVLPPHQQQSCSDLLLHTQHSFRCRVRNIVNAPSCKHADCLNRTSNRQLLRIVHTLTTPKGKTKKIISATMKATVRHSRTHAAG